MAPLRVLNVAFRVLSGGRYGAYGNRGCFRSDGVFGKSGEVRETQPQQTHMVLDVQAAKFELSVGQLGLGDIHDT